MLARLQIKDLAIVTSLSAEFGPGMTVLTGETGAGKSVLIDALGLALGDRADNGMIRAGCPRAEIVAVFDLPATGQARDWLRAHDLEADETCILRRILVRDSSSRAFINGIPATLRSLQDLGEYLVDIHGQHAHQSLLRPEQQRLLLDEYAGNQGLQEELADLYRRWKSAEQSLAEMRISTRDRTERIDLLRFQTGELAGLGLAPGEAEEIDREQRMLSNAGELSEQCAHLLAALTEDDESARTRVTRSARVLDEILPMAPALADCGEMLESAAIQIEEAVSSLRRFADSIEFNPGRQEQVEHRLSEIHDLARKYRCRPEELPGRLTELNDELDALENSGVRLDEMEQEKGHLERSYLEKAELLSASRQAAARDLERSVSSGISSLGMPGGRVQIQVDRQPVHKASLTGLDRVEFRVSTNQGQPPQPLGKVASGGELSRISLAIQVATIRCGLIPTLIFDEVDVGIGGSVAEIVGRLLQQLGQERQVLCVTHLPQVASQGQEHLLISKRARKQMVTTEIARLEGESRIEEIARMLGGVTITPSTLAHAREMVALASV